MFIANYSDGLSDAPLDHIIETFKPSAHGWKSADGVPDASNCYCLPGRAGGLPLTLVSLFLSSRLGRGASFGIKRDTRIIESPV